MIFIILCGNSIIAGDEPCVAIKPLTITGYNGHIGKLYLYKESEMYPKANIKCPKSFVIIDNIKYYLHDKTSDGKDVNFPGYYDFDKASIKCIDYNKDGYVDIIMHAGKGMGSGGFSNNVIIKWDNKKNTYITDNRLENKCSQWANKMSKKNKDKSNKWYHARTVDDVYEVITIVIK
jgi:hypothetical protein